MKRRLFTLALFLLPLLSLAQNYSNNFVYTINSRPLERNFVQKETFTTYTREKKIIPMVGICYQKTFTGEFDIMYADVESSEGGVGLNGLKIGVESSFQPDNYLIAPKIGVETSTYVCLRGNFLNYFQNNTSDFRLLLEIGPSLFTFVSLTYGYCPHLLMDKNPNISTHRVSLTVSLYSPTKHFWW
jgi:hypothetical protein